MTSLDKFELIGWRNRAIEFEQQNDALKAAVKKAEASADRWLAKVTSLERELAEARERLQQKWTEQHAYLHAELAQAEAQMRTPGTVEVCELCDETVLGGVPQESAICVSDNCPLRAHSPAAKEAE